MYMHMNGKNMPKVGDLVFRGQMIGRVGNTGLSDGPHVHFEIARGKEKPEDALSPKPGMRIVENPNTWNKWPASGSWNPKAGERLVRSKDLRDKIEAVRRLLKQGKLTSSNSTRRDPIVFDLDGDGIETTDLNNSGTFFDHDANGFAEQTAWVSPDDGLLVWDRWFHRQGRGDSGQTD